MKLVKGVKFASVNAGIRYKNRDDLMLAVFDDKTSVAGVFTKSKITSPTIDFCKKALKNKKAKALIVNSGNANCFTGKAGIEIIKKTINEISKNLNCEKNEIFISSTGVIGEIFDYKLITNKISQLVSNLKNDEESFIQASKAIMTTDLVNKIAFEEFEIGDEKIVIQGFCKGSGMIAPNMATMLAYIFTDAKINEKTLAKIFKEINEESFNSITVDSDCSTNDTALIFATNKSQNEIKEGEKYYEIFKIALKKVMINLAKKIVKDGEGAKKLIEIKVEGAKNQKQAKIAALAVANSPLVKSAIAASDPNWGRIMAGIGKSGAKIINKKLGLKIGEFIVAKDGSLYQNYNEKEVHSYLKNNDEVKISIDLGFENQAFATVYGCDLNEEYVKINKSYRS